MMVPALTDAPLGALMPKYWGFESRPFFAPLPPRFRAILFPPFSVYIQGTKFRVEFRHRTKAFNKESPGARKKIPALAGIVCLHQENSPLWSAAPQNYPFPAGKCSERRPCKD
jgi:hypothetical protein